ncbi:allantoate amidohydrolase [Streptomyces litchfieldiae]|uniref:Allantoate amidohydrolase n=1 Tax=Streptomyces litchfieldiae TaxID=3075543 RepID=A0ABU2MYY8_9ACTN|nr:allantoate amidohydrolase [Streptomyces sp. DSM 44938]MDT0346845.1 allantoate amidohydrolase [Streptomyces sp. DSM 44938]
MWAALGPVGRMARGGYRRFAWTGADAELRAWFREQAEARGLRYEVDRNGNQWAWHGDPARGDAVVTGSHLDSVPDGGAFDGPLGVVSAFAALDLLRERGVAGRRPLGVVGFAEEEGARFGVACLGSRLTCGLLAPDRARRLTDADGVPLAAALERAGLDPDALGPDPERLARIGAFVELHIEQGRALAGLDRAVGVGSAIWPHGRWRFDFGGEANHAGTTRVEDRRDPMLTYAHTVLAARKRARLAGALATFGKVTTRPNAVNAVPERVTGWLDSRAPDAATLEALVADIERSAAERGGRDGVTVEVTRESHTPGVEFAPGLRDGIAARLGGAPVLPTGAGHDAGILAAAVPTAMLYVRNPTGVSHAPGEHADTDDCLAGVTALADVLEGLVCR